MPKIVVPESGDAMNQNQNAKVAGSESRVEEIETRIEQVEERVARAEARTEQAKTRTELAETRTEQAETRIEQAKSRAEQAETRTEQAETRTELAELRAERAESALKSVVNEVSPAHAIAAIADPNGRVEDLTGRQREILQLVAAGQNTKQIAELLKVSPKTVEYHRMKLMDFLNIHDVPGLVRYAIRVGLLPQEKLIKG